MTMISALFLSIVGLLIWYALSQGSRSVVEILITIFDFTFGIHFIVGLIAVIVVFTWPFVIITLIVVLFSRDEAGSHLAIKYLSNDLEKLGYIGFNSGPVWRAHKIDTIREREARIHRAIQYRQPPIP